MYGEFNNDNFIPDDDDKPKSSIIKGTSALKYMFNELHTTCSYLDILDHFSKKMCKRNTDIEVEGTGEGNIIRFISKHIIGLSSDKSILRLGSTIYKC